MEFFHLAIFESAAAKLKYQNHPESLSKLGTPMWQQGQYIAYAYEPEVFAEQEKNPKVQAQLKASGLTWFKPTVEDLDRIIHELHAKFKVQAFTTQSTINPFIITEYDGDELRPINGQFNGCQKFLEVTNENINQIFFRGLEAHHSQIIVSRYGIFGFKHLKIKELRSIISPLMSAIIHDHRKAVKNR